jgi:preprotein translocase subunit SecG
MQKTMQIVVGLIALIIGIFLLVRGHDMAQSIGGQVQQAFTGAPSNRQTYFYIAGIALTLFGAAYIFFGIRPK